MEISNKLILIWFSDCSPPVKSDFIQLPNYSFWGNWFLEIVIKLCCNFRSSILVILPNKPRKTLTIPIRLLLLFSRVLLLWRIFHSFSNAVISFETFITLAPVIGAPTIWLLPKSDRSGIVMNFFWWYL